VVLTCLTEQTLMALAVNPTLSEKARDGAGSGGGDESSGLPSVLNESIP